MLFKRNHQNRLHFATTCAASLALAAAGLFAQIAQAQNWVGDVNNVYSNANNWTGDAFPAGINATINNTGGPGVFPVLDGAPGFTPVDIFIGNGATGRLDHLSGTLATGNGNWMFLGQNSGSATYNLANTNGTGGTHTGFGTGSGSLNVGGNSFGNLFIAQGPSGTSVVNMNTTGTLSAGYIEIGSGSASGTFNLDAGTVNVNGITSLAHGGSNTQTQTGIFNMSGGTYNSGGIFRIGFAGDVGATATANVSGGNLNVGTVNNDSKLVLGKFDAMNATLNVTGTGKVNLLNGADLAPAFQGNNTGTRTINVNSGGQLLGSAGSVADFGWPGGSNILSIGSGGLVAIQSIFGGGASNKTVEFNGGTLRALSSDLGFINFFGSGTMEGIVVQGGGGTLDSQGYLIEIQENATGTGGLTKIGSGTLYVGPVADFGYTGATNINAGTFRLGGRISGGGAVNIASGATLSASRSTFETNFSTITGALNMASGSTLIATVVDGEDPNVDFDPPAISAGSVNLTGSVALVVAGAENLEANTPLTVLTSGGAITGNLQSTYRDSSVTQSGSNLQLTLNSLAFQSKTWNTNSGTWNVGAAANWTGGTDNLFYNGDTVTFGASTGTRTITLNGLLQPEDVTVNSSGNYVFTGSGSIVDFDNTILTKNGTGSLTLATANSHEGGTFLNAGTLNVNHQGALGISFVPDNDPGNNGGRPTAATLTINGGTLNNTSGSPITTFFAVNQTWAGNFSTGAGSLNFNGGAVTVNSTVTATLGAGSLTVGNLTVGSPGTGTLNLTGTGPLTTQSIVVGGGDLGVGTLNIATNVTATGITIANSGGGQDSKGTLRVQNGGVLTASGNFVVGRGGGAFTASSPQGQLIVDAGGTVNVGTGTGNALIVGQFDAIDSAVTVSGTLNLNNGADIITAPGDFFGGFVNTGTRTITVDGGLIQGGAGSFIDFGYDGSGSNVLNVQNGGVVAVQAIFGGGMTNKTVNLDNGTLRAVTDDGGFFNLFGTGTEQLNLLAGGGTVDTNGFNIGIQDALLGSGDLTKAGAGTLSLVGDNSTYTGDTSVTAGTLLVDPASDSGWFDNASAVLVSGGALLDLQFTGNDTVNFLYLNGVPQSPGIYNSSNSGGLLAGTGGLNVLALGPDLGLPGDFNGDGFVNIADYTVWRDNLGATEGNLLSGNGDGGTIGASDYSLWKTHFGDSAGAGAIGAAGAAAVPEPSSVVLLVGIVAGALALRRRVRPAAAAC